MDSLYVPAGQLDYLRDVGEETDHAPKGPNEILSELITLCASLAQQLRSYQRSAESRFTIASLLGEMSLITTSLCRLQQHILSKPLWICQSNATEACFETTISGLRESFLFLQGELMKAEGDRDDAIHMTLQQLRDQRPSLEFLLESTGGSELPPTPPCDSEIESSLKDCKASGSSLLPPPPIPTGLTPLVDAKGWIDPPPEYSPPSSSSSIIIPHAEKPDVKAPLPEPPSLSTAPTKTAQENDDSLYRAVTDNDTDLVSSLLSHGADPNKATSAGALHRTPLHQAAHLNNIICASLLLRNGAITTSPDASGDTPLHLAAWEGHVESISVLLGHGAEIDYLSGRDGYSALWCAVSAHHIDCARLLLKHGARVNLRSTSGMMVLHQAAVTGQSGMCELLVDRGAQVDSCDEEGQTALHYAAATGSAPCVTVLVKAGAKLDVKQAQGLTPTHWAAHKGHTDVLGLLLEHGAQVDVAAEEGAMPLHLAANRGHLEAVKLLLEKGARRNRKAIWNGAEGTPAEIAKTKGHVRVAKFIESWRTPKS